MSDVTLPEGWSWGDRPKTHGSWDTGIPTTVMGDRRVLNVPNITWRYTPETCEAEPLQTEWLLNGKILVCLGCGLDST